MAALGRVGTGQLLPFVTADRAGRLRRTWTQSLGYERERERETHRAGLGFGDLSAAGDSSRGPEAWSLSIGPPIDLLAPTTTLGQQILARPSYLPTTVLSLF